MHTLKSHIISKITVRLIAILLLLPSAVKFTHAFNHFEHEVCLGGKSTHLHKVDLNCKFYDFKLNNTFYFTSEYVNLRIEVPNFKISASLYTFLNNHRTLSFSLRGPPVLV